MMNSAKKREIFYRAAAYIEAHPSKYDFKNVIVPGADECGCSWGHVGRIAGFHAGECIGRVSEAMGFSSTQELYFFGQGTHLKHAQHYPDTAPAKLRAFADHHWPNHEKPVAMKFPELMRSLGAEVGA